MNNEWWYRKDELHGYRNDQPSSSGILEGGADENLELEYSSLARVSMPGWKIIEAMIPHLSHEEIDAKTEH